MTDSCSIRSLLIFFAPVLIPRAVNFYRSTQATIAQRPSLRPLTSSNARSLNLLFIAIVTFLVLSLPFNPHAPAPNIFGLTRSRLNTSTDVIFNRLARYRPRNTLTPADTLLRSKLTSIGARRVYLRFGPDALTSCQFCSLDNIDSYLLYYLPFNTLLPHLLHMLLIGLATSAQFGGQEVARWRNKFTIAGLALAAIDLYVATTYDPVQSASAAVRAGQVPPPSSYHQLTLLRPLALAVFDGACAVLIYLSATNRFFFTPPSQADQVDQMVSASMTSLAGTSSKLHALSVTRNAVVRDKALKERDDAYWQTVVAMNGENAGVGSGEASNVWEEEEVVRAMSRAMAGQGDVDLAALGVNASEYVNGVTGGLERE